ncbi:PA2169 family four-helix-bundle protein [Hymenobacter busanensis]|uniref:PA2169 family four-helix-bundle protein n=1 Tax=Hymenobacter busanensis TaxID=2607656 RepID=A0A7L4ZSU3_9BACT|nr:PA2169 family four-helix-bundle protein [Hymenobacter busanensis]KAA9327677.1 PA2169 family four-helix-bundle protein [Hymenobacter busanensis]QHJ05983.1 PA2169 family four-helix-bundle protein [Hymenobacter busanensis]
MSHPSKPRVSTNSPAAHALSDADNPTQTASAVAGSQPTDSADQASAGASSQSFGGAAAPLLSQAQRWLQDSGLTDTLTQVPEPVKRLAGQASDRWRQLSTTQKVVGGAVLAAGSWYLLSRSGKSSGASARRNKSGEAATLHELLLFVNDRVEGYQRAAGESQDAELRGYYKQLVSQSQQFANKLNTYLRDKDGSRETGTTLKGKVYRGWMEAKAAVTGYDEKAVLGSNVYGEEWAIKAYEEALADQSLTGALRNEVQRQYAQSKQTYHKLKQLQNKQ